MQAALPSAECSPIVADSASESSSVPSPQEAYNKATSQQDLHQIAVDPNDTSALSVFRLSGALFNFTFT